MICWADLCRTMHGNLHTLNRESMSLWVKRLSGFKLEGSSSTNSPPVATCALHHRCCHILLRKWHLRMHEPSCPELDTAASKLFPGKLWCIVQGKEVEKARTVGHVTRSAPASFAPT